MDVKEQNRRKPVFALKRDCGNSAASSKSSHKLQGSKLSGEEKVRKTQGTVQSRCLKLPLNKPQQVSNPKTQCDNLICINELKIGEGNLSQQLTEVRNENILLKTLQHYDTVTIERQGAGDSISETITKCRNEVRALLRNTLSYRDQLQAKLRASEDRLLNTKDPFQHLRQHSQDHNLWEREQLSSMIAQPSAEQQERNEDLEGHIQLSQAWFNRQVASGQKSNGPMCCYPHYREHQLIQDLRDEACNLQTQKILKSLAPLANKDIPADGFVLPLTEAVGPVKSETYETWQLEEQQVEQKEEQQKPQLEEQEDEQLEEVLEEVMEEQLEEQEDEQLEEQEDEHLEEQGDEHLEEQGEEHLEEQGDEHLEEQGDEQQEDEQLEDEQLEEQPDEQEEEQLEEQQEGKEDEQLEEHQEEQKDGQMEEQQEEQQNEQMEEQQELQQDKQEDLEQKNPANLCCNDPVQASLDTETEVPTNSIKSHVDDPAVESSDEKEKSESPVASDNPLVFEEIQKTQEHVFEESLKMLTKTKQNYTFKKTIKNLHQGIPAYRCEYLKNPMRSPAVGSEIRNIPPKNPPPGDPTRDGAGSPLNRDATIRKFSHWVINR